MMNSPYWNSTRRGDSFNFTSTPVRFSPTRSIALNRWNWSADTRHAQYDEWSSRRHEEKDDSPLFTTKNDFTTPIKVPIYDVDISPEPSVDDNNEEGEYIRTPRSPITKLFRQRVEEDAPRRNFGDYDPVRPPHVSLDHVGGGGRNHLPLKIQNRRLIFKGISETEMKQRYKKHRSDEGSWRKEFNDKYEEKYGELLSQPEPEPEPFYGFHKNEDYHSNEEDYDDRVHMEDISYSRRRSISVNKGKKLNATLSSIVEERESQDSTDDHYYNDRYSSRSLSHYSRNDLSVRDNQLEFEDRNRKIMSGKRWYETDHGDEIILNNGEGAFLGSQRGFPQWNVELDRENERRQGLNRDISADAGTGYFSRNYGTTASSSSAAAANSNAARSSTSWMDYTQGTGFYQASTSDKRSPDKVNVNVGNFTQNSPISQGYVSNNGNVGTTQPDSAQIETGNSEFYFCDKICKLDYFYTLKRRPTEEKYGTKYFGYELEFWPVGDAAMKEVVIGCQMADPIKAKDWVFAAGLKKLENVKAREFVDPAVLQLKERIFGKQNNSVEQYGCGGINAFPEQKQKELETSLNRDSTYSQKPVIDYGTPEIIKRAAYESRPQNKVPERISYESRPQKKAPEPISYESRPLKEVPQRISYDRTRYSTETSIQCSSSSKATFVPKPQPVNHAPKVKRDEKEENFRIAIPRSKSMIDEQMRKEWKKPGYGRLSGLGY